MDYLDDFVCEIQSDEYEDEYKDDSFWSWIDEYNLEMRIEN